MIERKLWALIDDERDIDAQLREALIDGGLYATRPTPSFDWLLPVRVTVTIKLTRRAGEERS